MTHAHTDDKYTTNRNARCNIMCAHVGRGTIAAAHIEVELMWTQNSDKTHSFFPGTVVMETRMPVSKFHVTVAAVTEMCRALTRSHAQCHKRAHTHTPYTRGALELTCAESRLVSSSICI
jgi:hypothetical protein